MNNNETESIVSCMATVDLDPEIQRIQTLHRLKLAAFWNIKEGNKVLEIGCGQGDTTAVLASIVGEKGFVYGIDIAPASYGSPITLGDSAEHLKRSKLGKQINIEFEIDVLSPEVNFPDNHFDYIVLSHCSWYFKSHEEFSKLLKKTKRWGKQLCYAEWDTRIENMYQLPHFMAMLIQAQYECFKENSQSNLRTLFTPIDFKTLAKNAGWNIVSEKVIPSADMQDSQWEMDITLNDHQSELQAINNMPDKFKSLIKSQVTLLEASITKDMCPMFTYASIAD